MIQTVNHTNTVMQATANLILEHATIMQIAQADTTVRATTTVMHPAPEVEVVVMTMMMNVIPIQTAQAGKNAMEETANLHPMHVKMMVTVELENTAQVTHV